MLKGHVFSKQIFENPIFALFIDTFLNGYCGVSDKYKNKMNMTTNGSRITVQSGALCVKGRFIEEDISTTIQAGTDTAFCKLVIEMDLDKENTSTELKQVTYRIIKSISSYPSLTQMESVVKNNSGIYQYELARFKTSINGITEFKDMRTYLDFDSIYAAIISKFDLLKTEIQNNANGVLQQIQSELDGIVDRSGLVVKDNFYVLEGSFISQAASASNELVFNAFDLAFPDGFNADNCVCISFGLNYTGLESTGYSYELSKPDDVRSYNRSSLWRNLLIGSLNDKSKMKLTVITPFTDAKTIYFRIVLMKINNTQDNSYLLGDVNGDGVIDNKDLQMIQDYIMGNIILTNKQLKAADMNKDGKISAADYTLLQNHINGK